MVNTNFICVKVLPLFIDIDRGEVWKHAKNYAKLLVTCVHLLASKKHFSQEYIPTPWHYKIKRDKIIQLSSLFLFFSVLHTISDIFITMR